MRGQHRFFQLIRKQRNFNLYIAKKVGKKNKVINMLGYWKSKQQPLSACRSLALLALSCL